MSSKVRPKRKAARKRPKARSASKKRTNARPASKRTPKKPAAKRQVGGNKPDSRVERKGKSNSGSSVRESGDKKYQPSAGRVREESEKRKSAQGTAKKAKESSDRLTTLNKALETNYSTTPADQTDDSSKGASAKESVQQSKAEVETAKKETAKEISSLKESKVESETKKPSSADAPPQEKGKAESASKPDKEVEASTEKASQEREQDQKLADAEKRATSLEKSGEELQQAEKKQEDNKAQKEAEKPQNTPQILQLAYPGQGNGSLHPADSLAGRIEGAGQGGPISAEQAAEFTRELDAQQAPTDPARKAAFEKQQAEARTLIAEAQTPLMGERLGIQSDSQALQQSLREYGQIQGGRVANSLETMSELAPKSQPFSLRPQSPPTPEQQAQKTRLAKLNEDITAQNRQALRDGKLTGDPKASPEAQRAQDREFPNFSESLQSLESQQKALNEKYQQQGIDQQSNSPALAQTRETLEGADRFLRESGAALDQRLNGSQNPLVFGETPITSPIQGAQTEPTRETFETDKKTLDNLSKLGVKPQDMYLSPATHKALGTQPNTAPKNDPSLGSKSFLYGDLQGQDVSRANLDAYHTKGRLYDQDTKFAEGFNPRAAGMTRQLGVDESFQTHIQEQRQGERQQYATRVLETNNQFPNPDYNVQDPKSPKTVDRETFQQRYTDRQIQQVEKTFAQERSYVQEAGGYDQAVQALRQQAAEKFPVTKGGGNQGASLRKKDIANQQAEFDRLVAQHMPNHYQANQNALDHIRGEALGTTTQALGERPPTSSSKAHPRAGDTSKERVAEKNKRYNEFRKEYNKLKTEQLDQLREQSLNELQREDIQSAVNVDRDELDAEWAKVGGEQIQAEAAKAWESMSTDQRRDAMAQISAERIDMARYQANQLHRSGLQNDPENAERLAGNHESVNKRLDALQKDLAAGKVEEVEARLRNDNPSMNLMEFSSPENKFSQQSFEQNIADRQAQKEAAYQANGWWEDSPYAGQHDGAFMQDLHQRDILTISPNDAAKGLHTLEALNKSGDLPKEEYEAMKSKLGRAYDLGRVGQATRALDQQFGQMVDDQGVVGDFANGMKNQFGRPNGWVIDSNLGSDAINSQLAQAHQTRERINEMAHFKGTDAEFREQYQQHVSKLQEQVKGIETQVGGFQQSQDNWVEGISDVASVSAGLALAPVTGGASLAAIPLASGAVKVGVKGLEAATSNREYQGSVLKDFGKGALNGLSAYGTSKLAGVAEKAFLAGRAPGATTWMGQRMLTAAEGGMDGFVSGTSSALMDGHNLSTSLQQGGQGAMVGSFLAPAARTGFEGVSALRQVDAPTNPDVIPADGYSQKPSTLRMDGSQVDQQARQYLEAQGQNPAALDQVNFHTGQGPDGSPITTAETTFRPDGGTDVYLPADKNGRVSAHEAGHELDHALLAQRAAAGDTGAQTALREAQANYAKFEELRAQGAPAEELQRAQRAYQNSLAEHGGEASGNGFAAHQLDQISQTPKPKTGKTQDVAALERTQQPLRQAQEAHQAAVNRANPAQVDGPVPQRLAHDPKLELFRPKSALADAVDQEFRLKEAGLPILDDPKMQKALDAKYQAADTAGKRDIQRLTDIRVTQELQDVAHRSLFDESVTPESYKGTIKKMESLLESVGRDPSEYGSLFNETLEGLKKNEQARAKVKQDAPQREREVRENYDKAPETSDVVDPNLHWEDFDPTQTTGGWLRKKKPPTPPEMVGRRMSFEETLRQAEQMETLLARYGTNIEEGNGLRRHYGAGEGLDAPDPHMPVNPRARITNENLTFAQGGAEGPSVHWEPDGSNPGLDTRLYGAGPSGDTGAVTFLELPMPDGSFRYLSTDGHHRLSTRMLQGEREFFGEVVTLGELGRLQGQKFDEQRIYGAMQRFIRQNSQQLHIVR